MEKLPERPLSARSLPLTPGSAHNAPTQSQTTSSKSSSRRTSGTYAYESLPSPPPDPRQTDNIFQFPPKPKEELPAGYHTLFNYVENEEEFYKTLYKIIASDCKAAQEVNKLQQQQTQQHQHHYQPQLQHERHEVGQPRCDYCHHMQQECMQFIDPLQSRLGSSLSALLAAHGAVEQLSRLYALWDKYLDEASKWRRQRECLNYVNLLNEKMESAKEARSKRLQQVRQQQHQQQQHHHQPQHEHEQDLYSDTEADVEESIALIESILGESATTPAAAAAAPATTSLSFSSFGGFGGGGSNPASIKRGALKQQRERSKSMMIDDVAATSASTLYVRADNERESKSSSALPHMLRRQSTYSEGKSKVSKWTKVKAAFKWERANVPALAEGVGTSGVVVYNAVPKEQESNSVGLTPVNNEVARYLRVPSMPCGGAGSSADSILSSSSGHLLSEAGTPGTISSASSMDDIDSNCRSTLRRDSTKSDSRVVDDMDSSFLERSKTDDAEALYRSSKSDGSMRALVGKKSSSIKSLRKSKNHSDFEVLPEEVVADLKATATRRTKPPPSPLNLNLKQDLTDSDFSYSPYSLKSPKDGTQSLNRSKKIGSPGNSSVPSSPSRHSDYFCEFESEDLSSGDFSEPTTPNHLTSTKSFLNEKNEINQRYQMLRAKFDMEFEAKRREWEKMKANTNACRAIALITPPKPEEHPQHPVFNKNLSAKLLEENLTPDFKKKLRKWRVKKQISVGGAHLSQISPTSPGRESSADSKPKIDWNLWKTGQLKLEGQGLTPLPEQKDLPEDFQKKLEQWNKLKQSGGTSIIPSGQDSIKRSSKFTDSIKKNIDNKPHDKDKLEKLAKLKAIVTDHPAKEIEVKTSEGVMKFEGISRKFTRKLYEWEKARGIGPESSTFALLHPGYRPIVVDRITKENNTTDTSPTLSRSFSLDSIAQNNVTLPAISQQASSLSLNDVNELKEIDNHGSSDVIDEHDYKKYEEPEAVMVEVEDHIEETASPLVTAHTLVEQQTPIYKYEEGACSDYCNTRRVQSFQSHTNLAPLLSVLQRTEDIFTKLKRSSTDLCQNAELRQCETMLTYIRNIYPYYSDNLMKPNVLNAISDVQSELSRMSDLCEKCPLDEACCQETIEERSNEYNEELRGLHESLTLLRRSIHGGSTPYPRDMVPDINITTADVQNSTADTSKDQTLTTLEATDEWSASHAEYDEGETPKISQRAQYANNNGANGATAGKKKLRLRKTGSRQNSKTESDSSDVDNHSVLETPRRIKRKNFRLKQRSFDDDFRRGEEVPGDDVVYVLKVKPGHPIEQCEGAVNMDHSFSETNNYRPRSGSDKCLVTTTVQPRRSLLDDHELKENLNFNQNENVFVKTKRKVFTAFAEPSASGGIAVIERELAQSPTKVEAPVETAFAGAANTGQEVVEQDDSETPTEVGSLTPKRSNSTCKSLSQGDMRTNEYEYEDERKCQSAEKLAPPYSKQVTDTRPPLASDSFRVINKSCTSLMRDSASPMKVSMTVPIPVGNSPTEVRKGHRFKKNTEKSHYYVPFSKSQSATIKKIETKIAKTHSGASIGDTSPQTPDRFDNTLPRISRKLERKSLTPTSMQPLHFDFPTPNSSEPTTPLHTASQEAPHTPLSERALRLQRAKEQFLQGNNALTQLPVKRRDDALREEKWEQHRRSDYSMSSAAGEETDLPKSFSVGTITADSYTETPTHSDTGTDLDSSLYDSLPRSVSRSGKISSKLGFATLASKFRRGKGSKKGKDAPKDTETPKSSNRALSALCRQTLMADVIAVPQLATENPHESVQKSQSSPQAGRGFAGFAGGQSSASYGGLDRRTLEPLNKSQSEQYVRRHKESIV